MFRFQDGSNMLTAVAKCRSMEAVANLCQWTRTDFEVILNSLVEANCKFQQMSHSANSDLFKLILASRVFVFELSKGTTKRVGVGSHSRKDISPPNRSSLSKQTVPLRQSKWFAKSGENNARSFSFQHLLEPAHTLATPTKRAT